MPRKPRTEPLACQHCGRDVLYPRHGQCGACYMYRHRHGFDRPLAAKARPRTTLVAREDFGALPDTFTWQDWAKATSYTRERRVYA